ncbi:zinc ribbon domain-containing protein [Nostoc sp. DedQUE02]|uniref:zinc ribbon domain-containing protein n=1 Tax=Nostoc sp. DedQUE02 TaxID=3075388 RepID=UPI00391D6E02
MKKVYKQANYGTKVEIVDWWFSSKTCSKCSHIQAMNQSDRIFFCQKCCNEEESPSKAVS